jgi:phage tail sheath protein FI
MATTVNPKTFPGVYTQITDDSFVQPAASRFRPGLIGVATKGPFNTPTAARSLKEFRQVFGAPLTTTYLQDGNPDGHGFFLADAVGIISDLTDGAVIVRVGNAYNDLADDDVSGVAGSYMFGTAQADSLNPVNSPTGQYFVRIKESGKASTVGARVLSASSGTVSLSTSTPALAASYADGQVSFSAYPDAANDAEGILYAYTYGTNSSQITDVQVAVGTITGNKNEFSFDVQSNPGDIAVGDVFKIKEVNKFPTAEVRVKSKVGNTVYIETSDLTRVGYQALPLQDTYESAQLYKATGSTPFLYVRASTAGEWANGASSTVGLFVKVRPGSAAGSKKLEIYWDGALVETFDDLSDDPASVNWYLTRINNLSQYIFITEYFSQGGGQLYHAANTAAPWDSDYDDQNLSADPKSMPVGKINAGGDTGGNFDGGANGSSAQDSDFVGTLLPTDDSMTGLKCFEDTENVDVNVLAAPMNFTEGGRAIMQELNRVARKINAMSIADVPAGLNARLAVDWHRGRGAYANLGTINSPNLAVYFNWFNIVDVFTGNTKLVPPTLGALRCLAFTFSHDKPWYAAAGETRGLIPEALSVQFDRVSQDARQAMYGAGNSVNPILRMRNQILLWGERTMQIAESKLSQVHAVILVNYVVNGLAEIGRRYVFDPNDPELLTLIRLAFSEFLDKTRNERGMEDYSLVIDSRNNNADTRNHRQVIVDLALIPTDVAERIFINATVKQSGAVLNAVNAGG